MPRTERVFSGNGWEKERKKLGECGCIWEFSCGVFIRFIQCSTEKVWGQVFSISLTFSYIILYHYFNYLLIILFLLFSSIQIIDSSITKSSIRQIIFFIQQY